MTKHIELIKKVLAGETHLFAKLIDEYKDMGFAAIRSMVHDAQIAEEILQNVFVIAYQKLYTFQYKSQFSTWLYTITIRETFRYLKRKKRVYVPIEESLSIEDTSFTNNVLYHIDKKEKQVVIQQMLQKLAPEESLALQLFYLQELSLEEISTITKWSIPKIKILLHRARKKCKLFLTQSHNNPKDAYAH